MNGTANDVPSPEAQPTPPPAMIRTKVVATMGPAVADLKTLRALLAAGTDVCRLNFSHGHLDDHAEMLAAIREQAADLGLPVAVLGDLCGPKIRLDEVADVGGTGGMPVSAGQQLVVQRQPTLGRDGVVSISYPALIDEVEVGHNVLVEDGLLKFVCVAKTPDRLTLHCTAGGVLKTRKGVNLPDTAVGLPSVTERDWECVAWAIEHELDYLALSFVRHADELLELREHLARHNSPMALVAKIEKAEAIREITPIIEASDALMIARGDLGVEMDLAQVPILQKDLIRRCRRAGKPVIVATQMLQSMVENSSPTRAEVSDVANAIYDGTDALMLSGETSVGAFPVAAVNVMNHVAGATEAYLADHPVAFEAGESGRGKQLNVAAARAVRGLVEEVGCALVVVYSQIGEMARVFSKQRFPVPVLALSDRDVRLRQMRLYYGVVPMAMALPADFRHLVRRVDELVLERALARVGDRIILVAGRALGSPGTLNGIVVHTVGTPQEEA